MIDRRDDPQPLNDPMVDAQLGNGPSAPLPGVATHYLRYSTANVLVIVAGFISFPVLTRLLDNTQYGILGYYDTWVMLAVALAKLGAQHAIIRFYPFGGDARQLDHFAVNLFLLPSLLSLALWAAVATVLGGIAWLGEENFSPVFWCAVLSIPLMVFSSLVEMVFRASERSGLVMFTRVSRRWLELAAMLGAVIFLQRSAFAVYGGKILAALLVVIYCLYWVRRNMHFSRNQVDVPAMLDSLRYGLPLVASEIAGVALISIDRVMLKQMTGDFALVGIYTIGYSLAMQVSVFMHATLYEAFVPVVNRLHGTEGEAAVRALKGRVLLPMTYASIGVAAMLWGVGEDALVALSGPDKAASGIVFAVIGISCALYPLIEISGYGLLLRKRSVAVFGITLGAALLNIVLNLILIPGYGVMGSVWATVVSTVALGVMHCLLCPREFLRFPEPRSLALAMVCAAVLLAAIEGIDALSIASVWGRLFVAGGLFATLYVLPIWLLDARLRTAVSKWRSGVVA